MKAILIFLAAIVVNTISLAQWSQKTSGTTYGLSDVQFADDTTVYISGYYGKILKSGDSGESWSSLQSGVTNDLNAIHFLNKNEGITCGNGIMLRTNDGGQSWQEITLPVNTNLHGIYFVNNQIGYCVGSNGTILKTIDGGNNWALKNSNNQRELTSVYFPSLDTGYVVSRGYNWEVNKTIDGGETWSIVPITGPNPTISNFETVFFVNGQIGFVGGWYLGAMLKTTNAGADWTDVDPLTGSSTANLYDMYFPTSNVGYAVGYGDSIYRTNNQGTNWVMESTGTNALLYAVHFRDESLGIAVGDGGKILKREEIVGIEEASELTKQDWRIFPNPIIESITITTNKNSIQNSDFSIFDVSGSKVQSITLVDSQQIIDLSNINGGMYFYEIKTEGKLVQSGKLMKK